MQQSIIDVHCDLLFYLGLDSKRTPYDLAARCALPQLRRGAVKLQTLAIFTETEPSSVEKGMHQANLYQKLPELHPKDFQHFANDWTLQSSRINILMAFENASGFCSEAEPLQQGLKRLNALIQTDKPFYISLTWNSENRFGGGALTQAGLKEDGRRLLDEIDSRHIALDLSHASDALAYEAIDYIESRKLSIPIMASHSNARAIAALPRNLPDEIAKEIFRRKGIIGFNLYRPFVGESPDHIVKHFAHWMEMGGEGHLVFGTDFFNDADLPSSYRHGKEVFFKDYPDSSCYPPLLAFLQRELKLDDSFLSKVSHRNAMAFIKCFILPRQTPALSMN